MLVKVDGSMPTLICELESTLAGLPFLMMSVRHLRYWASLYLFLVEVGTMSHSALTKSVAVIIVQSPSEMVGVLQWAGYNLNVSVVKMPPVRGSKNFMRR